jgi:hypothetical protein
MTRLIDRVMERIVPKATASACSGVYFCNPAGFSDGFWFRYCCPQSGCEWSLIQPFC